MRYEYALLSLGFIENIQGERGFTTSLWGQLSESVISVSFSGAEGCYAEFCFLSNYLVGHVFDFCFPKLTFIQQKDCSVLYDCSLQLHQTKLCIM